MWALNTTEWDAGASYKDDEPSTLPSSFVMLKSATMVFLISLKRWTVSNVSLPLMMEGKVIFSIILTHTFWNPIDVRVVSVNVFYCTNDPSDHYQPILIGFAGCKLLPHSAWKFVTSNSFHRSCWLWNNRNGYGTIGIFLCWCDGKFEHVGYC